MDLTTKLTAKQVRFVEEYLCDLNATQAATRAGYSPKTAAVQGSRLLTNANVSAAIHDGFEERARRTEITQDMVIEEYAKLAFADMGDYVSWGPDGVRLKESAELPDEAAAAVVEVSETTTAQGSTVRFRLHSKVAALDSLGKHLGIFREPSVQERNAQGNIQRVEIHLDHGDRPPVVETHAIEVEALTPGDPEAEAYSPPADEGVAG